MLVKHRRLILGCTPPKTDKNVNSKRDYFELKFSNSILLIQISRRNHWTEQILIGSLDSRASLTDTHINLQMTDKLQR